jgi:SAM-dependent methyltransferase
LLALGGPDDAPLSRLAELLSIYLDGHWGDRASPPPDGPGARSGPDLVHSRVAETSQTPVAAALELGCSVGRGLFELARNAELCVGVDSSLAALRRARRLLAGKPLGYARRTVGRHYRPATIAAPEPRRVELICADAQDPPLPPARFDRVLALNLLDVVHDPQAVLNVAAGVTRPGGELHLTSPYAWATGFVGEEHRLGGADPAAHVAGWLRKAGWTLLEERDLAWPLRRDARSAIVYSVHYLRVRKALLR